MSDEHSPNNRSDAALRERLELAEKATDGPWKESVQIVNGDAVSAVSTACGDEICNTYGNLLCDTFDAAHIAANHPEVVRADIEEILRLRKERDWLLREIVNTSDRQFCPMPDRNECLYHVGHECKSREVEMRVGCWRTAVECAVRYEEEKNNAE